MTMQSPAHVAFSPRRVGAMVLRHWRLEEVGPLTDEAERARDQLLLHVARVGRIAGRLAERRAAVSAVAV